MNAYSESALQDMFDCTIWMLKIDWENTRFKQIIEFKQII